MSYDFKLFQRRPDEAPRLTAECDPLDSAPEPLDPWKESLKRRVADALTAHNPQLEVFQLRHDEIAEAEKISVDEARLRYRYLELNGPEQDSDGVQITIFDDEVSVTIAFWHAVGASEIFRKVWSYLEIISRETGYLVYDPQLDRAIDLSSDFEESLSCYSQTMRGIHATFPDRTEQRRPWWRFS